MFWDFTWSRFFLCLVFSMTCGATGLPKKIHFQHFSTKEGLSQETALAVVQDEIGFVWIGTQQGLNRFDGYNFKIFRHEADNPNSLSDNYIQSLMLSKSGLMWIGTQSGGLVHYDPALDQFVRINETMGQSVLDIIEDDTGNIWLATNGNGLGHYDVTTKQLRYFNKSDGLPADTLIDLMYSEDGNIWIAGREIGLTRFDPNTETFHTTIATKTGLSSNNTTYIVEDEEGSLWIATQDAGLNKLDRKNGIYQHWRHNPEDRTSLSNDQVLTLFIDSEKRLWIGTFTGLNVFHPEKNHFSLYDYKLSDPNSLGNGRVISVTEGRDGMIWIGTWVGGLNLYNPLTRRFRVETAIAEDPNSMSGNAVFTMFEDSNATLWIGTGGQGLNRRLSNGQYKHYLHDPNNPRGPRGNIPQAIGEDLEGYLWISFRNKGLSRFDPKTELFDWIQLPGEQGKMLNQSVLNWITPGSNGLLYLCSRENGIILFDPQKRIIVDQLINITNNPKSLPNNWVNMVLDDESGVWAATYKGLAHYDHNEGSFYTYHSKPEEPNSLSHQGITAILRTKSNVLWVGTQGGGLNRMDASPLAPQNKFTTFGSGAGLASVAIGGLLEDEDGFLWMSTIKGISRFNPKTEEFHNYHFRDGVQEGSFFIGSFCKGKNGRLYFGGINGSTSFLPKDLTHSGKPPKVAFTDFLLFNKEVPIAWKDSKSPLKKSISYTNKLELNYHDRVFSFEFTAFDFTDPERNHYAYKLENWDDDWLYTNAQKRFATYTNLDSGTYTLYVKGANNEGIWNEEPLPLTVVIHPPLWATWWAYLLYTLLIVGIVAWYIIMQRRKMAYKMEIIRQLKEVDRLKDEFLANTSHELRTPLNGIIGLTDSLIDGIAGNVNPTMRSNLTMIAASARRLSTLVNDVLDFSKLKTREINIELSPIDLHAICDVTLHLSAPLLKPDVQLINDIPAEKTTVLADENRLQQILYNLIGNAIKFTQTGEVRIGVKEHEGKACIWVRDTGIGIDPSKHQRIFESFEQAEGHISREFGGSGLGLAITKKLIELHGGTIWVESAESRGSTFYFTLDYAQESPKPMSEVSPILLEAESYQHNRRKNHDIALVEDWSDEDFNQHFHILIADDDPINCQVLLNHLALAHYRVTIAENGPTALSLIEEHAFDLILLDIMMPKMSGYETCLKIRENHPFQDLPIIFLTAKTRATDVVAGFSSGCNDYLTKPIAKDILLARVKTHLALLDIHRTLEGKITERTKELTVRTNELNEKNNELHNKYLELETLDTIVKTINHEVDLIKLVTAIPEQGLLLFPKAESSILFMWDDLTASYTVAATAGLDNPLANVVFIQEEANARYTSDKQMREGVWIHRDFETWLGQKPENQGSTPQIMLSMSLIVDQFPFGYLMMSSFTETNAFVQADVNRLTRFREHATSAIAKAHYVADLVQTSKELKDTQQQLLETAHRAGKAEIAINVLHSVGNSLNSVHASAEFIGSKLSKQRSLHILEGIANLLNENQDQLAHFFTEDSRGQMIPQALTTLLDHMHGTNDLLKQEMGVLRKGIAQIAEIVRAQHVHAQSETLYEEVDLSDLLDMVVRVQENTLTRQNIQVQKKYHLKKFLKVQRNKLIAVITHIIKNTTEAFSTTESRHHRIIFLETHMSDNHKALIKISDNAGGIDEEIAAHMFEEGYTNREDRNGFGLHYCANAMTEMHGTIQYKEIPGGACFLLELPTVFPEE